MLEARQNDNVLISDPVIEAAVDPLIQDEVILATAPKAQEQKKKDWRIMNKYFIYYMIFLKWKS